MCSALNPDASDPKCDSCDEPAISGLTHCGLCRLQIEIDSDNMDAVRDLVADGYVTQAQADKALQDTIAYTAWARKQNVVARAS